MEASSQFLHHTTRWQGPEPGEEVDPAVDEAYNRLRLEIGEAFRPLQESSYQDYCALEADFEARNK
jgi:hypothetical protein